MDSSRLSVGEIIAGASGVALLVFMFLPWYGVDVDLAGFSASESFSAWEVLSTIDVLLFLIAAVAIGAAVGRAAGALPADLPVAAAVAAAGLLGVLLILFRIIDLPGADVSELADAGVDYGRKVGIFLGLIAAGGIAYGGYRAMSEPGSAAAPPPGAAA